jgi:HK97 family phage major capsid protein
MPITRPSSLIPLEYARQILQEATDQSVSLRLGAVQRMTSKQQQIPVLSALPAAAFLAAQPNAVKPSTDIQWTTETITAEEAAATVAVPREWVDDSMFNLWGEIRPRLAEAIAKCVDNAIISGVGAPAGWPVGGIIAMGNPPVQALPSPEQPDLVQAISYAMSRIEATGLDVTGFAGRTSVRGHFRGLRATTGEWLVWAPTEPGAPGSIYGSPLVYSKIGFTPATAADLIVGAWDHMVIGLREDIRFDLSDHGVLTTGAGANRVVSVSAFEQDMVLMRVYIRLGYAVGRPVANRPDGTQGLGTPFANVKVPVASLADDADSGDSGDSGDGGGEDHAPEPTRAKASAGK